MLFRERAFRPFQQRFLMSPLTTVAPPNEAVTGNSSPHHAIFILFTVSLRRSAVLFRSGPVYSVSTAKNMFPPACPTKSVGRKLLSTRLRHRSQRRCHRRGPVSRPESFHRVHLNAQNAARHAVLGISRQALAQMRMDVARAQHARRFVQAAVTRKAFRCRRSA